MSRGLARLFQVLPDEGGKVVGFAVLAGLLQAGVAIGMVAADSLFLARLGIEQLPLVFVFMPVVMLVYAPLYAWLTARLGTANLFQLSLAILIGGGLLIGFAAESHGEARWFLFALKFYVGLWFIALYTLFWNFTDEYFSILDGKRLYGVISAGGSAGAMLGGGLVTALSGLVPAAKLFLVWAVIAILTFPVFLLVLRRFAPIARDDAGQADPQSLAGLLAFIVRTFAESRFALWLTLASFLMVAATATLEYLAMGVFAAERNADQLASLLGGLYAIAGAATLVINLFLFNRVVGQLGVGSTAMLVPLAYLGCFVLFFVEGGMVAALVAFYAFQSLFVAIEYNNINLLFNALPARVKPQLRTFIEAMTEPAATATAGLLLLVSAGTMEPGTLALGGIVLAALALLVAALIRSSYVRALAVNLRSDFLDFANPEQAWRQQLDSADYALLRSLAFDGNREQRLLAVDLLWRLRDPSARGALLAFLGDASARESEQLRQPIFELLRQEDTETLAETLLWLESESGPADPEVLEEFTSSGAFPVRRLHAWRHSREPAHLAALAVARWNGSKLADVADAISEVRELLTGDTAARQLGIRAIGDSRQPRHSAELLPFLEATEPVLRIEALRSLRKLASADTPTLMPHLIGVVRSGSAEERTLVLDIARKIGDSSTIPALLWAAEHFSAAESRQLEAALCSIGLKAIPGLIRVLRTAAAPFHSRTVAVRALSRLAMPQLLLIIDELIDGELARGQAAVMAQRSLAADPHEGVGQTVLTRYYRDAAAEVLEFVLELMSLSGRLPDFDLIRASLSFANARDRANAIETIQQSCGRELFQRILTLIQSTAPDLGLGERESQERLSVTQVLQRAAASEVALEASAGLIAYHERELPDGLALLRQRLDRASGGRIDEWLVALLPRFAEGADDLSLAAHPVDRVAALVRAEFFSDARIRALDYLAAHASERRWEAGELVYDEDSADTDTLYVIAAGSVQVERPSGVRAMQAGTTFGERVLMGDRRRQERAVSAGCQALVIPVAVVLRAIEIFPAMGVSLYQFKTISAFR